MQIRLAGSLLLVAYSVTSAQDQCRADLLLALRNVTAMKTVESISAGARQWFCSDEFERLARANDARAAITVPIEGVPVSFGGGSTSTEDYQRRARFCADASSRFDEFRSNEVIKRVVDPAALAVYDACTRKNPAQSISLTPLVTGSTIVANARFTPLVANQPEPIIEGATVVGATGGGAYFAKGRVVPVGGIAEVYQRNGPGEVAITLHTSAGAATISLPPDRVGQDAGKVVVKTTTPYDVDVDDGGVYQDLETRDHHCDSHCQGEPTKTHYKIELSVPKGFKLKAPSLACIAGPCPWSSNTGATLINNTTAVGDFYVWSRPMTWRLSGTKYHAETRYRATADAPILVRYGGTFTVRVPKTANGVNVTWTSNSGELTFDPANLTEDDHFQRVSIANDGEGITYTFRIKP